MSVFKTRKLPQRQQRIDPSWCHTACGQKLQPSITIYQRRRSKALACLVPLQNISLVSRDGDDACQIPGKKRGSSSSAFSASLSTTFSSLPTAASKTGCEKPLLVTKTLIPTRTFLPVRRTYLTRRIHTSDLEEQTWEHSRVSFGFEGHFVAETPPCK